MLHAYKTVNETLIETKNLAEKGIWIYLVRPTQAELDKVSQKTGILPEFLRAALDDEERPRIENDPDVGQILVLISVPTIEGTDGTLIYDTLPLGIIVSTDTIVTVCLEETPVMEEFQKGQARGFATYKRTRFLLQILFKSATFFLRYLKQIDKRTSQIEHELHKSMRNEGLIKLLNMEKSLVYFTTALRANEIVMEKLLRAQLARPEDGMVDPELTDTRPLKLYAEDEDLLEDVITENKQAIDMAEIHSSILSGMMDAFASLISNNLNIVMKFLTSVTIILALPTMVASFYGMNVALPFQRQPWAFAGTIGISILLAGIGIFILARKKMF